MEKIAALLKEVVSLIKLYGIDSVYWLIVLLYACGVVFPQYSNSIISASNIIVLGIIWLGVKLINGSGRKEVHNMQNKKRLDSNIEIRQNLMQLIAETHADRAYIMEYHNGKENPTLLPFIYLDMTYEETAVKNADFYNGEYQNMNASLFEMPTYLAEHYVFTGPTEKLLEVDQKIGRRFEDHGTKYCSFILLKSEGIMIGVMGVSYKEKPQMEDEDIQATMAIYSQEISNYLDLAKCENKKK